MEAGSYGYGLNIVLPGVADTITNNFKRVERDFRLTSVNCAISQQDHFDDGFEVILGTEYQDWFASWVICANIFGDGALPHFLPENGIVIPKGSSIVVKARQKTTTELHIALVFQGEHL